LGTLVTDFLPLRLVLLHGRHSAQILLAGELDHFSARQLTAAVATVTADPRIRRIKVDAALVDFCDAGGVEALLRMRRRATKHGVRLRMVKRSPSVQRVLDLIRADLVRTGQVASV
jgi:anti-anti-sigma factor